MAQRVALVLIALLVTAAPAAGDNSGKIGQIQAHLAAARARQRAIIWGMGGHVIKCGLAPVLLDLMRRGYAWMDFHGRNTGPWMRR